MTVHIVDKVRVTPFQFLAMPSALMPDNLPTRPYFLCKVKIDGRWHACDRQYQFGRPVHFARPIVIVLAGPGDISG